MAKTARQLLRCKHLYDKPTGKGKLQKYTFTLFEARQHQILNRLTCPRAGLSTVQQCNIFAHVWKLVRTHLGVPTVFFLGMIATLLLGMVLLLVATRLLRAVCSVLWIQFSLRGLIVAKEMSRFLFRLTYRAC